MYRKIGKTYLYDKTEDPLVVYERLHQTDENGIELWEEELNTVGILKEEYEAKHPVYVLYDRDEEFEKHDDYDSDFDY